MTHCKQCLHTSLPSGCRFIASGRLQYNGLSSLFQTFNVPRENTVALLDSFGVTDNQFNGVCGFSASVPRVMVLKECCPDTDMIVNNVTRVKVPDIGENCSNRPHV